MASFFALSAAAQYFFFLVLIFMPLTGVAGYLRIRSGKPLRPKRQRYRIAVLMQMFILAVTVWAAKSEGVVLLARVWGHPLLWVAAAAYIVLIVFRVRAAWPKLTDERKKQACHLLPDDPSLMRLWVLLSAFAGITEECAYRGLAYQLLRGMGVGIALSLLICVGTFAIGHMTQGWRGVLGTFVLAILFHGLVFLANSLYLAIAFHAAYNVIMGVIAMPILSEFANKKEMTDAVAV